ncbi:septal ring lytic transglycosylase RlpA family protein [Leptolyngbya sp. DQ-M1]|uniref:septal ring lytic transglycosylase RlpA family protein n=1 Tax=Leptolyngbya sp. DQ-M1 TaxID=2933920 RepID=UPI00329A2493
MNQKLISGLTAALLCTSTVGATAALAESTPAASQGSTESETPRPSSPQATRRSVVKVGEQQPSQTRQTEESIAKIHSHEISGRKAATLYVRNIPVVTFLGEAHNSSTAVKVGEVQASPQAAKLKYGATTPVESSTQPRQNSSNSSADPIARATAIAARLNQLQRNGVDANQITVRWHQTKSGDQFLIEANKQTIVAVDPQTVLPNSTRDPGQDALQVANRLRRLFGNAAPLREISNRPNRAPQIAIGPIRLRMTGMASWYGPGFHGNMSASGERFNQNALTAAHRTLPFGTIVQVTNLDNGRTVSVRINDRGPFSGDRVIDLSAGAARVLGLIQSGVAPVRLEVRDSKRVASGN